jgi:hypothetical protein
MGRENIPEDRYGLSLAASLEEAQDTVEKVSRFMTSDLRSALRNFNDELGFAKKVIEKGNGEKEYENYPSIENLAKLVSSNDDNSLVKLIEGTETGIKKSLNDGI